MSLREAWEDHAEEWIAWARTPGHDAFWDTTLPALLDALPASGARAVDIGCGEGRLSRELAARGYSVIGVEQSPTLVRAAAEVIGAPPVVRADAGRLPLRGDGVDLAIAFMSLQDIDELDLAVHEAARVLVRGGRFVAALVHPLASAGQFTDRSPNAPFEIAGSYLAEFRKSDRFERAGLAMTFTSQHRPLSRYFAALERAGLLVESLREVGSPDTVVADDPSEARWQRLPLFLVLRAVKR